MIGYSSYSSAPPRFKRVAVGSRVDVADCLLADQLAAILRTVSNHGWYAFTVLPNISASFATLVLSIAEAVGKPMPTRGRALVDILRPTPPENAHPRSLSVRYGTGVQPWHIDTAHRPIPARYLVFGCKDSGEIGTRTMLTDWGSVFNDRDVLVAARTEPFLIRGGRGCFYSTIQHHDRLFTRFDPGCMEPCRPAGRELQSEIETAQPKNAIAIDWRPGLIVIIDNWRMAHRRLDATNSPSRELLRVSVAERT